MTPIRYGGPPPPAPFFSLAFGAWIRLEREPQGRVRWFEPGDEGRLLEACGRLRAFRLPPRIMNQDAKWWRQSGNRKSSKELLGHQDIKTTLIYTPPEPGAPCAEVAKTERPAPTSEAVSTKSPQNSSATVESEERVR